MLTMATAPQSAPSNPNPDRCVYCCEDIAPGDGVRVERAGRYRKWTYRHPGCPDAPETKTAATSYEDKLAEAEEIRAKQDPNLYGAYRDALPTCENCGEVLDGVDSVQMSGSVGVGCNHCIPESEW